MPLARRPATPYETLTYEGRKLHADRYKHCFLCDIAQHVTQMRSKESWVHSCKSRWAEAARKERISQANAAQEGCDDHFPAFVIDFGPKHERLIPPFSVAVREPTPEMVKVAKDMWKEIKVGAAATAHAPLLLGPDAEGTRVNRYMRTAHGHVVRAHMPEDALERGVIDIRDIAHSLAKICRYTGHTKGDEIYSVAQHACLVHDLAIERDKGAALHHDSPEAYMNDLSSPLKAVPALRAIWKPLEARWEAVIRRQFNLLPVFGAGCPDGLASQRIAEQEKRIKALDLLMLGREQTDLMPFGPEDCASHGYLDERRPCDILPIDEVWSVARSRQEFLDRHHKLY